MPENISMEEFLSLTPNVEEEKENKENTISEEEFLALGKTTDPALDTDSGSGSGSSVFSGTGWGKPTTFVNTGIEQGEGRGVFKPEQTSTFENIPGATTIPKIKGFENLSNEKKVDLYNNTLGDDGFGAEEIESRGLKGIQITAPNKEVQQFYFEMPVGYKSDGEGGMRTAGIISLPVEGGGISTEQDIANFINQNKLSKEDNRKLDNKRYKAQRFLNNNFVEEFNNVITEEDLNGIDDNAISPIKALQEKNPVLFDDIRNNIMKTYEEKTGESVDLTNYQVESLFEDVVASKKNEQILASSSLLKTIQDDYKSGEYNYSWDKMVEFSTYTNVNNFTQPQKKLYTSIQKYKNGTLKQIQDLESHPNFDENSEEYKSLLEQQKIDLGFLQGELEKVIGPEGEAKFYVDYSTGKQVDQDFDDTEDASFEKYDITEEVNNYVQSIVESAGGEDDKSFNDNLTMAYERDAVESAHFNSHNKNQNIDFTVSSAMTVNPDSYTGFVQRMKRLGYNVPKEGSIKDIPVNVILDNWDLFKNHLDGAHQSDADDINTNYLGEQIKDWKDIGGYLKATKDMSISMKARDRAWSQLHLLNIDPSSYKRDKSDLYFSGFVEGLPWADATQQSDAKERIAKNYRGGAMSADQMITNSQNLIDKVNQDFIREGIDPIKVSKKQIQNLEKSRSEDFATAAGGFTPMVGEFFVAGNVTNGLLKVSKVGQYLNKMKATTYLTSGGRSISQASIATRAAKTGKTTKQYIDAANKAAKLRGAPAAFTLNTGKNWQKGLHLLTYSAIEEGKMWMLDPLFGTEMPFGSGFGFYMGGTAAKAMLPFKFGSQGSKFSQRFGRMVNPVWEKGVKGGFGGAVAAEVALPVEQLLGGHKSWKRWMEETYPDMNTMERRFTGNLALFGAFGFQHFNRADAAFTVGLGKYYQNRWNKKAIAFGNASNAFDSPNRGNIKGQPKKNTITVDGKEYTKEQANANYQKYLELSHQAGQYVNISEKVPEYQNPYEQKKMLDAQADKMNKDAIAKTGKPAVKFIVTTDGKNHSGKNPDAYFKEGKNGMSEIYIDARKVNDGQIPHEVYHHITNKHLKLNPEQNAALGAKIQNYVQKALNKSARADLDFMKFIEKNYGKEVLRYDKEGEIPANLIELLATNRGYDIFVSNNLISDIAFEYRKLTEKIFTGKDGKSRGGFAGKYLQPRLDLKDPATVVDYLARLASMSKKGEYNPNTINRLKEMLKDHRLGEDGKIYKKEKDGSETIVSLSSENIAKQIKLKNALKPLQDAYFAGKMSREEYYEKQAGLRAALVGIRDDDNTKAKEKPEYKRTIDETHSEGKERVNKNFHNHKDIIIPVEGVENLIPSQKKLNREYIFDMVETYRGRIVAAGKGKFDTPTYENMSLKEKQDFVFENTRDELIKHIERFNPETAVKLVDKTGEITGKKEQEYFDIDGYINSYVGRKEGTAAKKNTKKFFSETLSTEKANKIVDVETIAEVDLSKQIVLKDVLPLQPGTMETAKSEMLKGKDIEVWKRFLKVHPKIVLDKASDIEALTLKTIENVVPELIRDMYSSKAKIDAVKEVIESKELFINEQVKNGEMTPKRAEELKKQLKKSRKEIQAGLIAETIVDNIEAHKASVYSNVSEVSGMSTGLPNVMMSRKMPSGKVEDVFLAKQKASTKEGVKRVSTEMTTKTFDETGVKKKGNTAGNRPQKIIKLNNRQFLEKLGIKIEPGGEINITEMLADRNILTSLVPALQNSVNKMVTVQLFESLAKEMKGGADIKTVNNLNRIITKAKSGKNFDLASFQIASELYKKIVKENPDKEPDVWVSMFHAKDSNYKNMFPKKEALLDVDKKLDMSNQKKLVDISMKAAESDRQLEFITDKHIRIKKNSFEIFDGYGGKTVDKEGNPRRPVNESLKELAVERDMDMSKIIIDKTLKDRNDNHAEEYNVFRETTVEFMDPVLLAKKNVAQGTRYTLGEGQVQLGTNEMTVNSKGKPVHARLSAEQGKKIIKENMAQHESGITWDKFVKENPKYKNVNIDAMKVNDNADVMEKHHELLGALEYLKINEPGVKGEKLRMKYVQEFRENVLAQKGFKYSETALANDAMLEYFVETVNRVHKHFVDKGMPEFALNFTQQLYQNQTNAGKGFIRGLATHSAVTTQRATNLPIKFKNIKEVGDITTGQMVDIVSEGYRSEHEFQAANFGGNMAVNHVKYHSSPKDFKAMYDPIARSFKQTIIPKYVQKIIDKDGNTKSIFEIEGTSLDMSSKTNFLIDRIVAETTLDLNTGRDYAGILTNKVAALQIYRNLQNIAKKTGVLPSKGISKHQMIENARTLDKAIELARKKKEARGMSTWDFDDTLATTKSGVRATIPNPSGKPKPNRKVIFLAGGAGSGKGNVIKKLNLEKQGFKIVNSDISLEWLKKNNGLPENMNDLTKEQRSKLGSLQHQARGIAKRKMMKFKGNADGVVVDGTGGSIKSMEKLVNEFKEKGYDVSMLFVETSLQTALARNQARAERSLLDKIVEKNHEAVQGNKSGFKTMFGKRFMEVKTDKLKQEDAMPAELVTKMKDFVSGYEKIRLDAEQFATEGQKILDKGGEFDFAEFNVVTGGEKGPFFQKALDRAKKFGTKDQFVLTARPPESAGPIHQFLKSQGLDIPLENITGLGNSTGEAKALWMLKKFSEGYNDMYFADDAMQNVKAVRDVLSQLDVKSKVQQALASKNIGKEINKIMEHSLDIGSEKVFSKAEAKVRGKDIKRRRVFMRDSAADLELLIEPLYGKGKEGIKNKKWFKENLVMPFERGIRDYNTARQSAKNDYMGLRKQNKDVVKEISKPVEGTAFTNDMAMRVYLWNKAGYKIPDLAKTTEAKLVQHITNNPKLQAYAENFAIITKQEKGLKEPGENWWGETMAGEVTNINRGVSRKQYLQEWIDAKNEIFTEANLNKMESKLGTNWRENITDMFDRMETGRTRSLKLDKGSAAMMNYLNGGIGTIMNFNTRSAVLQTISTTNFLNMKENNPVAAARAMGNVKQFAKDFKFIMNSDMLKQRRDGLAMNVTEAEIASAAASSKNPIQSIISKVLKAGYLPTKMADSFAISLGGATFYRNRIKMYEKQGMKTKEAEKQAFLDFQVIAERTQQSSRADLLSKEQTSLIGRFILPFANTPMQMNRRGMKDILDISKGRYKGGTEVAEKVGRITYYMGAQVAIFAGLQSALFAMLLNDDDVSEEKIANSKSMMLNTTADSMLRGFGIPGATISAFKNAMQEYFKQSAKPGFTVDYSEVAEDLLNISPPIGSKFGMLDRAGDKKKWAKIKKNDEFKFELGNPSLEASLMTIQATTNAPVYSPYQNLFNMSHALSDQYETWQRVLMGAGWTPYSVGVETEDKKEKKSKDKGFNTKTFNKKTFKRKTFN